MSLIRRALFAACVAAGAGAAVPASGDPAIPDFGQYVEDDLEDYNGTDIARCSQKPSPQCVYNFNSSSGGGFLCGIVPITSSAYCFDVVEKGEIAREVSIGLSGRVHSTSEPEHNDEQHRKRFEESQTLPPGHKVVYNGKITCGAGEDGSVACQNAAGHGFVLSHDSTRTW